MFNYMRLGLLEAGSMPDELTVNIMMKNVIDVLFGGLSYWFVGYGLSYGTSQNGLFGTTLFCVNDGIDPTEIDPSMLDDSIDYFSHYIFQFTFAATATTIVSGAVAGRMKFTAYIAFSFLNSVVYCVSAHWVFHKDGWLMQLGAVDFAGDGPVHLFGAMNGAVGAWMVGPRFGWPAETQADEGSPANRIFGLFLLWWGWLGFNCGSTFGISGSKWLVASRVAVTTINASIGAGVFGVVLSLYQHRHEGRIVRPELVVNSILAGLVAITGGCACVTPAESLFVGAIGAGISNQTNEWLVNARLLDDPVGAVGVHGTAAIWGLIAVGIFADSALLGGPEMSGLVHSGSLKLLGNQCVAIVAIGVWSVITSALVFKVLDLTIGLRADPEEIRAGLDWSEHRVSSRASQASRWSNASRASGASQASRASQNEDDFKKMKLQMAEVQQELQTLRDALSDRKDEATAPMGSNGGKWKK